MAKNYYSFLLRIFRVGSSQESRWLASLEEPHSQRIHYFVNLQMLYEFLEQIPEQIEAGIDPSIDTEPDEECDQSGGVAL